MARNFSLVGKICVVTGAAGGIGKAVTHKLYDEGAIVVATDLNSEPLKELQTSLAPERFLPFTMDITKKETIKDVRENILSRFDRVDLLFANAGIASHTPVPNTAIDDITFEHIISVNLIGTTRFVQSFLPDIVNSRGHVLITASVYSYVNGILNGPYAISKAGIEMYGRVLRTELTARGASAGVLYPGWVSTDIAKNAFGQHELATQLTKRYFRGPLGKPVKPNAVAEAVVAGIYNRSPRIIVPRYWAPISAMRGLVNLAVDRMLERDRVVLKSIREIERKVRKERKSEFNG